MLRWVGHGADYVLDGGLGGWGATGLPLDQEIPRVRAERYVVEQARSDWVVSADQVPSELAYGAKLVDARAPERYQGVTEPIDPVAGHVPGAVTAAGLGDGRVYVGSWSEWIRDPQRPIATGAAS